MKKIMILALTAFYMNATAQTNASNSGSKNQLSLEVDPAPFILGGYSFSLKFSPQKLEHFSLMASVYSSEFPDKMMGKENYENGFRDLKIETSYALFTDYYLKGNQTGFHFGPSVFLYSKSVGEDESIQRTNFKSIYPNIRIGYLYKPFRNSGFYLNPWFNFGKEIMLDENNSIDEKEYKPDDFSYIFAIHLGYSVSF